MRQTSLYKAYWSVICCRQQNPFHLVEAGWDLIAIQEIKCLQTCWQGQRVDSSLSSQAQLLSPEPLCSMMIREAATTEQVADPRRSSCHWSQQQNQLGFDPQSCLCSLRKPENQDAADSRTTTALSWSPKTSWYPVSVPFICPAPFPISLSWMPLI